MNLIEHLWWELKETIYNYHPELLRKLDGPETQRRKLRAAVEDVMAQWKIDSEWHLPEVLVASTKRRLTALKKVAGWQTKY